jgi:hypothetical protein
VARNVGPADHHIGELRRGHAGMRARSDLEQALLAARHERRLVAREHSTELLLRLPFCVLRRERLDAVEREGELEIHWLLAP